MSRRKQAGFTLIELLIAIALVAAISAGLLTSMRNALLTMERTQQRLQENRRALGIQDFIRRQIGGAMPVKGICGSGDQLGMRDIFRGDAKTMLLVSNESMLEGSRGRPRLALYQVRDNRDGTVRLEVVEQPFSGPASATPYCNLDPSVMPTPPVGTQPFVLLDHLASCRFIYRDLNQSTLFGRELLPAWVQPWLPYAVRIELEPAPNSDVRMPVGSITIPLLVTREPGTDYYDDF
jgi:prepilin-type N-terminal cleavage/methylation domain-containing protein